MRSMLARFCTAVYLTVLVGIAILAAVLCLARFAQTAEHTWPPASPAPSLVSTQSTPAR